MCLPQLSPSLVLLWSDLPAACIDNTIDRADSYLLWLYAQLNNMLIIIGLESSHCGRLVNCFFLRIKSSVCLDSLWVHLCNKYSHGQDKAFCLPNSCIESQLHFFTTTGVYIHNWNKHINIKGFHVLNKNAWPSTEALFNWLTG